MTPVKGSSSTKWVTNHRLKIAVLKDELRYCDKIPGQGNIQEKACI